MIQTATQFLLNRLNHPSVRGVEILKLSNIGFERDVQDFDSASIIPSDMAFSLPVHKNINLPWFAATGLAVWFLFVHTPPFWIHRKLITRDVILAIHIVAASTIYLSCAHNCMFTPSFINSFGKSSKTMHVWVGRIGMVAGIISFSLGAFLAWSRLGLDTVGGTTLAFALPITIGGIAQLSAQYYGYSAIRRYKSLGYDISLKQRQIDEKETFVSDEQKICLMEEINIMKVSQQKALRNHIGNMISLFVSACGIPAGIRLAEVMTGGKDGVATIFAIVSVIVALSVLASRYMNMMMPDSSIESGVGSRDGYESVGSNQREDF